MMWSAQGVLWNYHPPDRKCGCGIYALDDLADLHRQYKECENIVAVISASGRTIECNNGIRTKYARVVVYWVLDHDTGCRCRICSKTQNPQRTAQRFPYVECALTQFRNAVRWLEPDEMAEHYGLKATHFPRLIRRPKLGEPIQLSVACTRGAGELWYRDTNRLG